MQVTRTDRALLAFSVLASAYVAFLVLAVQFYPGGPSGAQSQ